MSRTLAVISLALASSLPAAAQQAWNGRTGLLPCDDWLGQATALAEPWEENTRTFSNGAVRLAVIDVGEPAVGGYHLWITSPPRDEQGLRQCRILSYSDRLGFGGMDFARLTADYDPTVGLIFTLPVRAWDETAGDLSDYALRVTLNQATGAIGSRLIPGS